MQLRDYQERGINEIRSLFNAGTRRACYVAPCGAGKTRVMEHMATEAAKRGRRTTFLVHRQELIRQAAAAFAGDGIDYGVIAPGHPVTDKPIQIASVQTIARRKKQHNDLLIFDEAHHCTAKTWRNVIDAFPDAYVVGLTATPARLGGQGLGDVFESLVMGPAASELIKRGFLAPYKYYAPPVMADLENIRIKAGDFDGKEIEIRVDKPKVIGDAIDHYQRLAAGKQAIVYCASVVHSQNTAAAFNAAGIRAEHVDGSTPKAEREQTVAEFKAGKITVLTNVDLFGEGVDVPSMEAVILLRPTQSLTLYIQQSMRGMRPDKNNIFKEAIILDHVGNVRRHGLPDAPREWSLDGATKRRKGATGGVGVRVCPNCYMCHAPAARCPYCGYEYKLTARQLAEEAGELAEYVAEEKKNARMTVGRARTIADLEAIARERNYKPAWVRIQAKIKNIRG